MVSGVNPHDPPARNTAKIKKSLFGLLDDACKTDKQDGSHYAEAAVKQWKGATDANGPLFIAPRFNNKAPRPRRCAPSRRPPPP